MDYVLAGLPWSVCLVYLDDIIVHGKMFDTKLESLNQVFACLRRANLKLAPGKCHLFCQEVKYLGHIVTKKGITTDPNKIKCVQSWPRPQCLTELQSFRGLCSYYRKFIQGFAEISRPLTRLTEKNQPFVWGQDAERAFQKLKITLVQPPIHFRFLKKKELLYSIRMRVGLPLGSVIPKTIRCRESHRVFQPFLGSNPASILCNQKGTFGRYQIPASF